MVKLLVTVCLLLSRFAYAVPCDDKSLCEPSKLQQPVLDRESNGRNIQGVMQGEAGAERKACFKKECSYRDPQRMQALFDEVKTRIPDVIRKGRADSSLSAAEKATIKNFESLVLLDPVQDAGCKSNCTGGGNGKLMEKGICVCPWMEAASDEFLIFVMGHECGHAGDVCSRNHGLKAGQHPFEDSTSGGGGSVLSCLQTNGIQGPRPDEDRVYTKKAAEVAATVAGLDPKSTLGSIVGTGTAWLPKLVLPSDGTVHCRGPMGSSHMQEASADVLGFEVLGSFLRDHPLKSGEALPKRLFSFLLMDGCKENQGGTGMDHHSPEFDRVTKIGLSLPSIREALHCTGHSASLSCDYRPASGSTGEGNPASTAQSAK